MRRGVVCCLATAFVFVFTAMALATAGNFDTGFGTGGRVLTDFAGDAHAYDVLVQPDGRIVAAGDSGIQFAIAPCLYPRDAPVVDCGVLVMPIVVGELLGDVRPPVIEEDLCAALFAGANTPDAAV